jgi:uncharacterized protein YodC (DUF2158 family)
MSKTNPTTGDIVRLKSGGPAMTIKDTYPDSSTTHPTEVTCIWFNKDGQLQQRMFKISTLRFYKTDQVKGLA